MDKRSSRGSIRIMEVSRVFFRELQGLWREGFTIWSKRRGCIAKLDD
jgi:hypothetical protein